jgi:DNA-binding XRE family transcriptional regulator
MGHAVERLRREADMTQAALARATRLHYRTVGKIERGEVDARWATLRQIARGLGVELRDLMSLAIELAPGRGGGWLRRKEREAREAEARHR